jgi:hypothetical protein
MTSAYLRREEWKARLPASRADHARTPSGLRKAAAGAGAGRAILDSAGSILAYRRRPHGKRRRHCGSVLWPAASIALLGIAKSCLDAAGGRMAFRAARAELTIRAGRRRRGAGAPLAARRTRRGLRRRRQHLGEQAELIVPTCPASSRAVSRQAQCRWSSSPASSRSPGSPRWCCSSPCRSSLSSWR